MPIISSPGGPMLHDLFRVVRAARPSVAIAGATLLLLVCGSLDAQQTARPASESAAGQLVYRIPVDGTVEMGLAPFISRSLREAQEVGAAAAILEIETPGGRIDAAQQITNAVADIDIPVYAFVNKRALSAGAMIALSTDRVFMHPAATMGAATPVDGQGETASEKMVSVMRAEFRALAQAHGLDPAIAAGMVDPEIEIPGIVQRGELLTLTTDEAQRIGFAEETADWNALLSHLNLAEAEVIETRVNWAERVVRFVTNPLVAPFLLSIGFLGLIMEVKTPAFGMAGLAGVSSLGLFFGSHLIVGLAGWEVVILLALGVVLLLVEALILPGFGVAGFLGAAAVAVSIILSMLGSFPTAGDIFLALNIFGFSVIVVALVSWQILRRLPNDRRAQNLWHRTSMTREEGYVSSASRPELVGTEGITLTDLRPAGAARFGGEQVDVVSVGPWVSAGKPIRVLRSEGYRLVVEPLDTV